MSQNLSQVFNLQAYANREHIDAIVVTQEPTDAQILMAAWAYAVRYTAKGLDLPDHEAAIELLKQRHPSWTIVRSKVTQTGINLALADKDEPELPWQ